MTEDKSVESKKEPEETEPEEQKISLFLTIGLVVGALIIGLVVGYAVLSPGADDAGAPAGNVGGPAGAAPQLTPDQIEGGQLPSGHPPIEGVESTGAPEAGDEADADGAIEGPTDDPDAPTSDTE